MSKTKFLLAVLCPLLFALNAWADDANVETLDAAKAAKMSCELGGLFFPTVDLVYDGQLLYSYQRIFGLEDQYIMCGNNIAFARINNASLTLNKKTGDLTANLPADFMQNPIDGKWSDFTCDKASENPTFVNFQNLAVAEEPEECRDVVKNAKKTNASIRLEFSQTNGPHMSVLPN